MLLTFLHVVYQFEVTYICLLFLDGIAMLRHSRTNPNRKLPNPKLISNAITSQTIHKRLRLGEPIQTARQQRPSGIVNQLFVFYGQFLDHDVSNSFPVPVTQ